jgi:hypothetical protein
MPFEKGNRANPGGRPKTKHFTDALRLQALRPVEFDDEGKIKPPPLPDKPRYIDVITNRLIADSIAGLATIQASKEVRDTLEGKPAQSVEHSGVIATTHEEYLKQLDSLPDDADGENDTAPA